jgi:hypothetical protein
MKVVRFFSLLEDEDFAARVRWRTIFHSGEESESEENEEGDDDA